MSAPLRILHLEDVVSDAELIGRALQKAGLECELRREETREGYLRALDELAPDLVLADYRLRASTADWPWRWPGDAARRFP